VFVDFDDDSKTFTLDSANALAGEYPIDVELKDEEGLTSKNSFILTVLEVEAPDDT